MANSKIVPLCGAVRQLDSGVKKSEDKDQVTIFTLVWIFLGLCFKPFIDAFRIVGVLIKVLLGVRTMSFLSRAVSCLAKDKKDTNGEPPLLS